MVEEWDVENPEGHVDNYSIHICPEVVIVFGLSKDGKVLLLDQFFIAQQLRLHTLVAGAVDRGRDRLEVAKEELREEAGCEAEEMIELGYSYLGKWTTGKRYFYLAKGVEKKHEQDRDQLHRRQGSTSSTMHKKEHSHHHQ